MSYNGPDESEDYGPIDELSAKIHELIETEAKARFAGVFEEMESTRKRNTVLSQELSKLRQQVGSHEMDLKKALREKDAEVKRELFGGFTIGDTVFYPKAKYNSVMCETCKGNGKFKITLDDGEHLVNCPKCSGNKNIGFTTYSPQQDRIRSVHFEMNQHNKWLNFYLEREDCKRELATVFKTIEECQTYCDGKNPPKATETTESPSEAAAESGLGGEQNNESV